MTTSHRRSRVIDTATGYLLVLIEDALRLLPPDGAVIGHEPCDYPCEHRGWWVPRREPSGLRFWEWECLYGCPPTLCEHCHGGS